MSSETIGCGHVNCQCVVLSPLEDASGEPEATYCSDACREADQSEEERECTCGHPPCDSP